MPMVKRIAKNIKTVKCEYDLSNWRLTLDEPEDYDFLLKLSECDNVTPDSSWQDIVRVLKNDTNLREMMPKFERNIGGKMDSGAKIWKRATKAILNGNSLLSKRPEMFLTSGWPTYFTQTQGILVTDTDGREFKDFSYMGIGTNLLGYSNTHVDSAVMKAIRSGNMSTLNCVEEVALAERLLEMCAPWAGKVKFARSGGEANALALRIARAASGKEKVAICGYHGWHDWYLAANIRNERNLNQHLLPGLDPTGVPTALGDAIVSFNYNDFEELQQHISTGDVGVVFMEVMRNVRPVDNFLKRVRKLCDENGIVLIFDECSSGFRESFGGLHKCFDVTPDIAMFGKALGNGYAITAVVGKEEIMQSAANSFISSTFWTEKIGPTAALATLKQMEQLQSWEIVSRSGELIINGWKSIFDDLKFDYEITGLSAMPSFKLNHTNWLAIKQRITRDMLARGYMAVNTIYLSTEHTQDEISLYLENLNEVMHGIKSFIEHEDVGNIGEIVDLSFGRLN